MQTPFDKRDNNFDFIRLALAVLVIFSHSYPLGTGSETKEPFSILTLHQVTGTFQVTGGHIAVDLFFIISGFLITASFERTSSVASYMKKRVYRIYPGFTVAMLVSALVFLPMSGGHLAKDGLVGQVWDFVAQTARLQEFHFTGAFMGNPYPVAMNGSVWSIQYEFWCYIGVVVLGVSGLLRRDNVLLVIFYFSIMLGDLFAIFRWNLSGNIAGVIFGYPPYWARLLPMYLAGMVFYRFRQHLTLKAPMIAVACGLALLGSVLPYGWPLFFPLAGGYLVLVLAYHPAIRLHGWSKYGDFSYGTYLYAFPVQQLIMKWIGHPVSPFVLFGLATPLTLLCAVVSWHGVEKWFLQRAHRVTVQELEPVGTPVHT
jgi:peptidoglycan/LPS O-acetylase OafA/YrhL